jgi:hypothetical protein
MPYKSKKDKQKYHKQYHKKWYNKNKENRKRQIFQRRNKIIIWFKQEKKKLKCERCPESHVACLEFHHKNPKEKEFAISELVNNRGWSIKRIKIEISKCIVLCSNCHRKEHYKED